MIKKAYIGVDIGGTTITAGCLENNALVNIAQVETGAGRNQIEILSTLFEVISQIWKDNVVGIGLAVPGYLDIPKGEIILINNIPTFSGLNISQKVSEHFQVPVSINNDANCFVLGEGLFRSDVNFTDVVGLTLGTGLGGGILVGGKIASGIFGGAGEFGCIPYLDKTFEDYCSGKFFKNALQTSGRNLFIRAENGDDDAIHAFDQFGHHLGQLIRQVLYFIAPEAIIIGGSVANSFKFFHQPLLNELQNMPEKHLVNSVKILKADLNDAALYGAASLVM